MTKQKVLKNAFWRCFSVFFALNEHFFALLREFQVQRDNFFLILPNDSVKK